MVYFRFSLALDLIQEHHKLTGCVTAATAAAAAAKETKIRNETLCNNHVEKVIRKIWAKKNKKQPDEEVASRRQKQGRQQK